MNYKIIGETVPVVEVTMNAGESMYTQSGEWHIKQKAL